MVFGHKLEEFNSYTDVIVKLCQMFNIKDKPWMWTKPVLTVRAFFYGLSEDQIVQQLAGYCQTGTFTCTVTRNADLLLNAYQVWLNVRILKKVQKCRKKVLKKGYQFS